MITAVDPTDRSDAFWGYKNNTEALESMAASLLKWLLAK
jgi:hypothetical protein